MRVKSARAFAPEEVRGQSQGKDDDGGCQVAELYRVMERKINGVADNRAGGSDENQRSPRIARDSIWNLFRSRGPANGKDCGSAKTIEDPTDKYHALDETLKGSQLAR